MAAGSPCPTCRFPVPAGAERCPQCGRVFGEANRCPHCHAVAAVRPTSSGYVCAACGKPRALVPGTTLAGAAISARATVPPRRRGLRVAGGLAIAIAIASAALATAILGTSATGIAVATAFAAMGMLAGVRLLRRASTLDREVDEARVAARMQAARQLLLERGPYTVPELAEKLGITEAEADAIASRLAADDRTGVSAEVDETVGLLRFGKRRELVAQTRVVDPDADRASPDEDEGMAEDAATRTRRDAEREAGR
jgi:hypothetical protein